VKQSAWFGIAAAALALGACERGMRDMYDQPKYGPLAPSALFADGNSSRRGVAGTLAHSAGSRAASSAGRRGLEAELIAPAVTAALLERGRGRYGVFCEPCHGSVGDGDGIVPRRGFPHPPSYHIDRLRDAPDAHIAEVIADGYGAMPAYGDRVDAADRAAIVAYVRALQLSQHAPAALLSENDRAALSKGTP